MPTLKVSNGRGLLSLGLSTPSVIGISFTVRSEKQTSRFIPKVLEKFCVITRPSDTYVVTNDRGLNAILTHMPQRTSKILLVRLTTNENELF